MAPVLVSTLFFAGCIKPNNEAFEAPPDLSETTTEFIEILPETQETYLIDSLNTTGRQILLVGKYDDGAVGSVSCNGYFQFLPEGYPQTYPANLDPDSISSIKATLSLRYTYEYGGEINGPPDQFGLYRLTQSLDGDKSYYSNSTPPAHEPEPFFKTETGKRTKRMIELNADSFGKEIFKFWKDQGVLKNDKQFLETFKGFALKSLKNAKITRFDLRDSSGFPPSFLVISYYVKEDNVPVKKVLKFRTNSSTVQFYTISPDYTGIDWSKIISKKGLPASESGGKTAVQAGTGLTTKIEIPGIAEWKNKQVKKIKIFKAILEIKPENLVSTFRPPDFLKINMQKEYYNPDESDLDKIVFNDEIIFSILQSTNNTYQTAKRLQAAQVFEFNSSKSVYSCNITRHIQAIVDGSVTSTHFNLYSAEWGSTVNRVLIPKGNVKLKIFYFPL